MINSLKKARFISEDGKEMFFTEGFSISIGTETRLNWAGESKKIKQIDRFTECYDKNKKPIYENDSLSYAPETLHEMYHIIGKVVFFNATPYLSSGKVNKPLLTIAGICEKKAAKSG